MKFYVSILPIFAFKQSHLKHCLKKYIHCNYPISIVYTCNNTIWCILYLLLAVPLVSLVKYVRNPKKYLVCITVHMDKGKLHLQVCKTHLWLACEVYSLLAVVKFWWLACEACYLLALTTFVWERSVQYTSKQLERVTCV